MRLKKIAAAALALAMTASMMAVPAFAAEGDHGEGVATTNPSTTYNNNGKAETQVKLVYDTDINQLSVTVPISVTFAVLNNNTLAVPTTYAITNNSYIPVHVDKLEVKQSEGNTKYSLVDDFTDKTKSTNEIKLAMTPADGTAVQLKSASQTETDQNITKSEWNIGAAKFEQSEKAPTTLGITFEGSVNGVDAGWIKEANNGAHLFTLVYTVAAGAAQ